MTKAIKAQKRKCSFTGLLSFSSFRFNFFLFQIGSSEKTDPELVILPDGFDKNNILHIKLDKEGCFNAVVRYNGVLLNQGQLTVISLNCKY